MRYKNRPILPGMLALACCAVVAVPLAIGGDDRALTGPTGAGIQTAGACLSQVDPAPRSGALKLDAMDVSSGPRSGQVTIDCRDGQPLAIEADVQPGQQAMVILVVGNDSRSGVEFRIESGDAAMADWLEISPATGEIGPGGRFHVGLTFRVPAGLPADSIQAADLELEVTGGNEGLYTRLPIIMNVREEQPLFRDRFDVDPVLGQFSHLDQDAGTGPVTR